MKSTKKFIDFVVAHMPPPPSKRPQRWAQLTWEESNLRKAVGSIYKYRSKALHAGVPFPAPMCHPGMVTPGSDVPSEIPTGLASSMMGGVWKAEDTPMLLHVFEYISRNAILCWWRSLDTATVEARREGNL